MASTSASFASLIALTGRGSLAAGSLPERLQLLGDHALLAEHSDTHLLECRQVGSAGNLAQRRRRRWRAGRPLRPLPSRLHLLGEGAERCGIVHGEIGEHLAIDLDPGLRDR